MAVSLRLITAVDTGLIFLSIETIETVFVSVMHCRHPSFRLCSDGLFLVRFYYSQQMLESVTVTNEYVSHHVRPATSPIVAGAGALGQEGGSTSVVDWIKLALALGSKMASADQPTAGLSL